MISTARVAGLATALVLLVAPLLAQGHEGGGMGKMGGMMDDMAGMMRIHAYDPSRLLEMKGDLALTSEQVSKLQGLASDIKAATAKAKANHDAHHAEVEAQFQKVAPDAAQVSDHIRAAMSAMADGHAAEVSGFAQAKGLLTVQQQQKVEAGAKEHEKMMKGHGPEAHQR